LKGQRVRLGKAHASCTAAENTDTPGSQEGGERVSLLQAFMELLPFLDPIHGNLTK